jgi:hypothetical protein
MPVVGGVGRSVTRSTEPWENGDVVSSERPLKARRCLACGAEDIAPRRRYCSPECREQTLWVLSLSKGLLRTFSARYAAFSFTSQHVILDVLPIWSNGISRFVCKRNQGKKPAEDLKHLILESGKEWYDLVDNHTSRSYASLSLLQAKCQKTLDPKTIRPNSKTRPRLTKGERDSLRILNLDVNVLSSECCMIKIKSAYKKMAKVHHPDAGGDAEMFKRLNEAHQQMLVWAENPQFTSRKALQDCWSYNGATNRWAPPL